MSVEERLKNCILAGGEVVFEEAMDLYNTADEERLFRAASEIRAYFCGRTVDLCSIMSARLGGCSEDCHYCAQSAHFMTGIAEHPLVDSDEVVALARENEAAGVRRFSLVTSGNALTDEEFRRVVGMYRRLRSATGMVLCASLGRVSEQQARELKSVGVSMYHHNLETGPSFFPRVCSTHTYEDRVQTIENVRVAGLEVCSGGIFGMGESIEDRIEMALELRRLGVYSVPINILVPIKGTPLEHQPLLPERDIYRTIAVYRFLLPRASLRFAGGRVRLGAGQIMGYHAGLNAALVGNLLTTVGNSIDEDKQIILRAGLEVL